VSKYNFSLEILKSDMDEIRHLFKDYDKLSYSERIRTKNKKQFGKIQACIRISDKESVKFLIENDYKSKSFVDPYKILSIIPDNKKYLWWRGYFDGDAGFYCKSSQHSFTVWGSYNQDYSSACNLFKSLGIKYSVVKYKRDCGMSSCITIKKQKDIKKLGNYLYLNNTALGLKRKYNKYLECISPPIPLFKSKKSKIKGIHFSKWTGKWICRITVNKKRKVVGTFSSLDKAITALNSINKTNN
jgi:hypothetical protein